MFSPRTSHSDGQIIFTFITITWQEIVYQLGKLLQKKLGLFPLHNKVNYRLLGTIQVSKLLDEERIGQKSYIHNNVCLHRYTVFEPER